MTFSDHSSKLEYTRQRGNGGGPGLRLQVRCICDTTVVQLAKSIIGKSRTGYRNQTQAM